jgi:hypothetical protein
MKAGGGDKIYYEVGDEIDLWTSDAGSTPV